MFFVTKLKMKNFVEWKVKGDIQELRIVNGAGEAESYFCDTYTAELRAPDVDELGSGDPEDNDDEDIFDPVLFCKLFILFNYFQFVRKRRSLFFAFFFH